MHVVFVVFCRLLLFFFFCAMTCHKMDLSRVVHVGYTCIIQQMGHCIGGNFNIHIWALFGYSIHSKREIRYFFRINSMLINRKIRSVMDSYVASNIE